MDTIRETPEDPRPTLSREPFSGRTRAQLLRQLLSTPQKKAWWDA